MYVRAKNRYVRVSPYKLRPIADVIRGYSVDRALAWLRNCALKKVKPISKVIYSAYSNGKNLDSNSKSPSDFYLKEIRIDHGPIVKYYKPGAMGRASIQRKRFSHIEVVLEKIPSEGDLKNNKKERSVASKKR